MPLDQRQFLAANRLIDQLLDSMLTRAAGASWVWLGVIHNGISSLSDIGLLRYDVPNTAAAPGRAAVQPVPRQPLSDWSDWLPALCDGACFFARVGELRSLRLRAAFETIGADVVMVCPVADGAGRTVGAIFIFWDGHDLAPAGAALQALMSAGLHLGAQIAAILDLRGTPPDPAWSAAADD